MEVLVLEQIVEAQAKTMSQMENTHKQLWSRVDLLTEKANRLEKKQYKGNGKGKHNQGLKTIVLVNRKGDEVETSEQVFQDNIYTGRDKGMVGQRP